MSPDHRTLLEAAFGALMIRTARPQPTAPVAAEAAEQDHNSMPSNNLSNGGEPAGRAR
ncbi:MAG TPA: hypothetical protein VFU47_05635 [Armatimonadota bacterium]|nr:hypothetical protein [Armatimonadota bacterium]